ncbi:MAG TPA: GAF domain-containing protein [Burkholderiales bacterium]|nr:GAF domain-containing protein [Burkholderiales bacterium]
MENHAGNLLARLSALANFQDSDQSLDENLQCLSEMTAKILDVENCSIMLSNDSAVLRVCANYGKLAADAYKESVKKGDGIAGHVLASGESLLIEDISNSRFARHARYPSASGRSVICVPITVNGTVMGVININGLERKLPFNADDLNAIEIAAAFTGKIIRVIQLQRTLRSRFVQMSLGSNIEKTAQKTLIKDAQNPGRMAKILAKSFYREMIGAGFGPPQIIDAASEIISELGKNLRKYKGRIEHD